MLDAIQERLAVLGRVPWLIGGDWNVQPTDAPNILNRGGSQVHIQGPTHKLGENHDWYIVGPGLRLGNVEGHTAPGSDRIVGGVEVTGYHHVSTRGNPNTFGSKKVEGKDIAHPETGPLGHARLSDGSYRAQGETRRVRRAGDNCPITAGKPYPDPR